jgi:undecaprenyl diphosphate synthase
MSRAAEERERLSRIPRHVAIIMDGNGRWAQGRGLPRIRGHQEGAKSVRKAIRVCREVGIEYLTLYAFSVENWVRPDDEISGLVELLRTFLRLHEKDLHRHKLRLRTIGRVEDFPPALVKELQRVEEQTRDYTDGQLVLALSYGGRTELARAARRIAEKVARGELQPDQVDEAMVASHLYAPDIPDPDLMIRTSGEMRISNFLLWQLSYSELYFADVMWPEFREEQFLDALREYARRERRFGGLEAKR